MDANQNLNTALIFIKPHAATAGVEDYLVQRLSDFHIAVVKRGTAVCTETIIDRHYGVIATTAFNESPSTLFVGRNGCDAFEAKRRTSWESAARAGRIISAGQALAALGGDISELDRIWNSAAATSVKLAGGMYVRTLPAMRGHPQLSGKDVLNGFYPAMRRKFLGAPIRWFVVEWDAAVLSWKRFRRDVVGPTKAKDAPRTTIRRHCIEEWKLLGMTEEPTGGDNTIHASAGPVEALHERQTWLGKNFKLRDDAFGRKLWAACTGGGKVTEGTPLPQLMRRWLCNERITVRGVTDSAFELLEEMDSVDVLSLAAEMEEEAKMMNARL